MRSENKYLKWEDLDFANPQRIYVLIDNKLYWVKYFYYEYRKVYQVYIYDNDTGRSVGFNQRNIHLFNAIPMLIVNEEMVGEVHNE